MTRSQKRFTVREEIDDFNFYKSHIRTYTEIGLEKQQRLKRKKMNQNGKMETYVQDL